MFLKCVCAENFVWSQVRCHGRQKTFFLLRSGPSIESIYFMLLPCLSCLSCQTCDWNSNIYNTYSNILFNVLYYGKETYNSKYSFYFVSSNSRSHQTLGCKKFFAAILSDLRSIPKVYQYLKYVLTAPRCNKVCVVCVSVRLILFVGAARFH